MYAALQALQPGCQSGSVVSSRPQRDYTFKEAPHPGWRPCAHTVGVQAARRLGGGDQRRPAPLAPRGFTRHTSTAAPSRWSRLSLIPTSLRHVEGEGRLNPRSIGYANSATNNVCRPPQLPIRNGASRTQGAAVNIRPFARTRQ